MADFGSGESQTNDAHPLIGLRAFRIVQVAFWVGYVFIPIYTGLLAYDWLPNESYDEKRHESIASHPEDWQDGRVDVIVDAWRDRASGRTFAYDYFSDHRRSEALRLAGTSFAYGLVGCIAFALGRMVTKQAPVVGSFGKALLVNTAFAIYTYLRIRR